MSEVCTGISLIKLKEPVGETVQIKDSDKMEDHREIITPASEIFKSIKNS